MKTVAQQVGDLLGRIDLQRQPWMAAAPARHARQQPALREGRQYRHPQALLVAGGGGRRRQHAFVQLRQRALHGAQQGGARAIEHDAAPAALEQREAQLFFQALDLLADGAVGQVQALGGRAQILQFGDRTEGGQGVQGQTHGAPGAGY